MDMSQLLAVAIEVAERGGNEVKQVQKDSDLNLKSKGKTREGVVNPLTNGDVLSHFQMYYGLKKMFPGLIVRMVESWWLMYVYVALVLWDVSLSFIND